MAIFIQPFVLLINIALFKSIYAYNKVQYINGYSLEQMIWYFTVVGFVQAFMVNFVDTRISSKVLSGELTIDLLRPMSVFRFELGNAIALRTIGVLMEFVPGIVLYSMIFAPKFLTVYSVLRFIPAAMLSFLLFYLINFLLGLTSFIIKNNSSLANLKFVVIWGLGGGFIPLEFYSEPINNIISFLPFKYMFFWPIQIYLNREPAGNIEFYLKIISIQLLWALVLYFFCRLLWNKAVNKFCSAGG